MSRVDHQRWCESSDRNRLSERGKKQDLHCVRLQRCAIDYVLRKDFHWLSMNRLHLAIHRTEHHWNSRPEFLHVISWPVHVAHVLVVHFAEGIKISKLEFFSFQYISIFIFCSLSFISYNWILCQLWRFFQIQK